MYVKISNDKIEKYPYNLSNLTEDFPNTSFPLDINETILNELGIFRIEETPGLHLEYYEALQEMNPIKQDGRWVQQWKIVTLTDEELEFRTDLKSRTVREERKRRLIDTDWVMVTDSPLSSEDVQKFRVYRQLLRDISLQEGFPWNVDWPTLPS